MVGVGPAVLMLTVLMLPWLLSGSLLWLLWYTLELEPRYPWYSAGISLWLGWCGARYVDVDGADIALVPLRPPALLLWYTLELEPMFPWYSAGVS